MSSRSITTIGSFLLLGELNSAYDRVASRNLLACQICRYATPSRCFGTVNDADLAITFLSKHQIDSIGLNLIDLLEAVPTDEYFRRRDHAHP